jgi:hypothetical protein
MDQANLAVLELEERTVGRDALDGRLHYRPDLYVCDLDSFPLCRGWKGQYPTSPPTRQ